MSLPLFRVGSGAGWGRSSGPSGTDPRSEHLSQHALLCRDSVGGFVCITWSTSTSGPFPLNARSLNVAVEVTRVLAQRRQVSRHLIRSQVSRSVCASRGGLLRMRSAPRSDDRTELQYRATTSGTNGTERPATTGPDHRHLPEPPNQQRPHGGLKAGGRSPQAGSGRRPPR